MYLVEAIKSISTLSSKDYAEICSAFITLTEPKYRCADCKKKYSCDAAKWSKHREHMACNYYASKSRHFYMPSFNNDGNPRVNFTKCIGNYYNAFWANLINYHPKYEKGLLPFDGSLMNQPAKFVEVMALVHNLVIEKDNEKEQQAKRNGNRQGKR